MTKKLIGLFASVALMGSGVALAGGDKAHDDKKQTQSSTGGSGTHGGSGSLGVDQGGSGQVDPGTSGQMGSQPGTGQQLSSNEITGRVVKSSKKMVWVDHMGAVVPLTINKQTQFNDPNLKRAQDFKAGDEVRANFEVKDTDNIATSIQKAEPGMGGSGMQDIDSTLPPAPVDDTGSGSDLTPRDIGSEGSSSDLGSDTGVDSGNKAGDQ